MAVGDFNADGRFPRNPVNANGFCLDAEAQVVYQSGNSGIFNTASWAACLDIGRKYAGSVSGAMNMAGQAGSFLSSIVFGYMVTYFHSYDLPLIPMAIALFISSALWLKIDPTKRLVPDAEK